MRRQTGLATITVLCVADGGNQRTVGEVSDRWRSAPAGRQAQSHGAGAEDGGWATGFFWHLGRGKHDLLP